MEGDPKDKHRGAGWRQGSAEEGGHGPCQRSPILPRGPSAGRGRGCGLPAPGLQGAQHGVQRLERGLLLQPEALPGHQPELQPLQQLGHDHLHLHLGMRGWAESTESASATPRPLGPRPPAQDKTPPRQPLLGRKPTLASYLSKLLPDAGAGAQGEGEVGEPRPAGREVSEAAHSPATVKTKPPLADSCCWPGLTTSSADSAKLWPAFARVPS